MRWLALAFVAGIALALGAVFPTADVGEIADELPVFPGAELLGRKMTTRQDGSSDLSLVLRLPPKTTRASVDRFLRTQLDESWSRPGGSCEGFARDGVLLLARVESSRRLRMLLVSDGAHRCTDYAWFMHS